MDLIAHQKTQEKFVSNFHLYSGATIKFAESHNKNTDLFKYLRDMDMEDYDRKPFIHYSVVIIPQSTL